MLWLIKRNFNEVGDIDEAFILLYKHLVKGSLRIQ